MPEWRSIPVLPEAIAGDEQESEYSYTTQIEPAKVQDYYEKRMAQLGWELWAAAEGDDIDYKPLMFFKKNDQVVTVALIVNPDTNLTYVLLMYVGQSPAQEPSPFPEITPKVGAQETICSTENEQARQFYNEALDLRDQGDVENAKQLYLKAIELDPNFCDAMDNLGQLLRTQGDIEGAINWYQQSIQVRPDNTVAHMNLAIAYRMQGKTERAIGEYERITEIDPENPEGYYGLGNIYLYLKQPHKAIVQLEKAEELYEKQSSPWITDARYSLGAAHYLLAEYKKAIEYIEMIYPEMQNDAEVNFLLGMCYLSPEVDDLELAKKYINKAQELGMEIPADVLQKLRK